MALPDLTPDLEPIKAFHEADPLEQQLKALTLDIFREFFRHYERDLNTFGSPHLGSFEQIERWIKADGLSMVRGNSQDAMRYLFKAWRARNPKRGFHFLRTYLQLLWPDGWGVAQLWQLKNKPYPEGLVSLLDSPEITDPRKDHYLTSRVNIDVFADNETGVGLASVGRALRSVLGAKFIVLVRLLRAIRTDFGMVNTAQAAVATQANGGVLPWVDPQPNEIAFWGHAQVSRLSEAEGSTDPGVTPEPATVSMYGYAQPVSVTLAHTVL